MHKESLTFEGSYDPFQMNVLDLDDLKSGEFIRVRTQFSIYYLMLVDTCFDGAAVVICGGSEEWLQTPSFAWYIGALTKEGVKQKIIQGGARLQFECLVENRVRNLDTSQVEINGIAFIPEGDKKPFEEALVRYREHVIEADVREFSTTIWEVFEGSEGAITEPMMQFLRAFPRETQVVLQETMEAIKDRGLLEKAFEILEPERTLWGNTGLVSLSPARNREARLMRALRQLIG